MDKQKRVKLTHGSARVNENCSSETINALDELSKCVYKNEVMAENEVPRRNRLDMNSKAELAIENAMAEVEKMDADVKLTDAVIKLTEAKRLVSDYIDSIADARIDGMW